MYRHFLKAGILGIVTGFNQFDKEQFSLNSHTIELAFLAFYSTVRTTGTVLDGQEGLS